MKAAESIAMKEGKLICSGAVRALGLVAQAFFFTEFRFQESKNSSAKLKLKEQYGAVFKMLMLRTMSSSYIFSCTDSSFDISLTLPSGVAKLRPTWSPWVPYTELPVHLSAHEGAKEVAGELQDLVWFSYHPRYKLSRFSVLVNVRLAT
ncbi:hypothetical protein Anapl_07360 [Anas platyrhynchos]|uniref:Uncharacterized protein n=1 Tax=Anas platyrhynchos TaxID=8839 RepID=R0LUA5_ANAPL|nr:hypothetical protein Anapl_07360 [Anas platyrhynchos]